MRRYTSHSTPHDNKPVWTQIPPTPYMSFASGGTYSRTGATTYYTSASTVASSPINTRRNDIRSQGAYYLVEGTKINSCLQSEDLSNASWTKTNCTISANSTASPLGTSTADTISVTSSGSAASVSQSIAISGNVGISVWVRTGATSQQCSLTLTDGTTTVNTNFTPTSTWTRVTAMGVGFTNPITFSLAPHTAGGTGTAGNELVAWGAQAENTTLITSYTPTTTIAVTRGEDILTYASGQWNTDIATKRTLFEIYPAGSNAGMNLSVPIMSFGTVSDEILLTNTDRVSVVVGGSTIVQSGALTWGVDQRIRIMTDPAAGKLYIEGATTGNGVFSGTAYAFPTAVTLGVGRRPAAANTACYCRIADPVPW